MMEFFKDIKFANPEFFYLFLLLPLMALWSIFFSKKNRARVYLSTSSNFSKIKKSLRQRLSFIPPLLRLISFGLLIIVLARPQSTSSKKSVSSEGIDIVIALDVSTSMKAEDFKPNRLEAAKKTAVEFIKNRIDDRVGLVIFAAESYTQCPITIDHDVLINLFESITFGKIEDGTAIGNGLATAVSRLKDSKAKSKVIILLTDGVNNSGFIDPISAADIAMRFGIKVYTIGVGTKGTAPYPVQTPYGKQYVQTEVQIDEALMKQLSANTNGKYFRATNNKALKDIYDQIDSMEKTKVDVAYYSKFTEEYMPYGIWAFAFFILELFLRYTYFRRFPQ